MNMTEHKKFIYKCWLNKSLYNLFSAPEIQQDFGVTQSDILLSAVIYAGQFLKNTFLYSFLHASILQSNVVKTALIKGLSMLNSAKFLSLTTKSNWNRSTIKQNFVWF